MRVDHAAETHRVGVVGLGYVGLPLALAFAEAGSEVVGLDADSRRAEAINSGTSHVEDVPSADLASLVEQVPALRAPVRSLTGGDESPAAVAAAVAFVLEGLHLSKRLNKDTSGARATYRGRS